MTEWILSSSILILVVIALRTVFKGKISLRLQYAIWGLVLLRLLIPVSFGSTNISVANLTVSDAPTAIQTTGNPNTQFIPNATHEDLEQQIAGNYENLGIDVEVHVDGPVNVKAILSDALPVIWAVGFVSVAGLFLFTNARFKRKIMDSRYGLGLRKNNLDVYATGEIDTPCLFGIKNPAIYVTYPVADDPTLLRHTLEHEATHYRHGDHIWAVLRCVCLAIHWYNPLVWWAAFLSQRDAELACDEATIKRLGEGERAEYGRTLIGMTCQKKANVLITATTMNSGKSGLKERIMLIAKKPKMALYTLLIVVLVASIAACSTFTGANDKSSANLTGTKVFAADKEVTEISVQGNQGDYVIVTSANLQEMTQWALSFEYGDIVDDDTIMEPGSNTFSVTLYYADGTEQTSYLDYATVDGVIYRISRDDLPDFWYSIWYENDQTIPEETVPTETLSPEIIVAQPGLFTAELDDNKVCIAVQPTGRVSEGGAYLYIIPEDQATLLEYYTAANSSAHTYTKWDSSNQRAGWWIVYRGQWWQVTESGAMFGTDQETWDGICIDADDAKELYEFCDAAVKGAGIAEPVRPEDITEIKSATLDWNGVHTITDKYALEKIEKWFINARETSSVSCWFTAQLTLELENGQTRTVPVATDSCAAWMSEGVVYSFGEVNTMGIEDNGEFYSFFATELVHEKAKEGVAVMSDYWRYVNWRMYANTHTIDETFALMDMFKEYAMDNPTDWIVTQALKSSRGLDGAFAQYYGGVVAALFEADPAAFSFACSQMIPEQDVENAVNMLAFYWNITPEEVVNRIEAARNQN